MKQYNLFPRSAFERARLLLVCVLASLCVIAAATPSKGQASSSSRPVARLVTSYRPIDATSASGRLGRSTAAVTTTTAAPATVNASSLERRAFDLINEQRRAQGESPLVWDAELCRMARLHSENMARLKFLAHAGPDGMDMTERARAAGVRDWSALGENIAYNQGFSDPAAFAVERWMQSTKHRANILRAQFNRSAIGSARAADGSIYFTQVFIER